MAAKGEASVPLELRLADILDRERDAEIAGAARALLVLPPNSRMALLSDLRSFADFCAEGARACLPTEAATVLAYADWLAGAGKKVATVRRHLSSIAWLHKAVGSASPCTDPLVRQHMSAMSRQQRSASQGSRLRYDAIADGKQQRLAPSVSLLLRACGKDLQGARDAAMLSLAYECGLRPSELVAVRIEQVERNRQAAWLHIPGRNGMESKLMFSAAVGERIDRWLALAGLESGPLFRRVMIDRRKARPARAARTIADLAPNARVDPSQMAARPAQSARLRYRIGADPLTVHGITHILRRLMRSAASQGLIPLTGKALDQAAATLSAHSPRLGRAQDLLAAGEGIGPVTETLRWRSKVTAARHAKRMGE